MALLFFLGDPTDLRYGEFVCVLIPYFHHSIIYLGLNELIHEVLVHT